MSSELTIVYSDGRVWLLTDSGQMSEVWTRELLVLGSPTFHSEGLKSLSADEIPL